MLVLDHKKTAKSKQTGINMCTYPTLVRHKEFFKLKSAKEVGRAIAYCQRHNRTWHAIARGKNWGYGSKLGHKSNTTLLDLSQMKSISINESHQYATIEPGVTQKDLYDELRRSNSNLMLPITGSSSDSSIIGNAMTLGYGNGRKTVRMESIIQVDGYSKDGNFLKGIDHSTCKYSMDSSFNQLVSETSQGAIITRAKIQLPVIPEHLLLVAFSIDDEESLLNTIRKLTHYKSQGLIEGNWSVFSAHRLIAERFRKPDLTTAVNKTIPMHVASDILRLSCGYETWNGIYNGVFACYLADFELAQMTTRFIENDLNSEVGNLRVLHVSRNEILNERKQAEGFDHIKCDPPILSRLRTFAGILQNGSIDIAYWKQDCMPESRNLDRDSCGFLWSAHSVPNDALLIKDAKSAIESVLMRYGLDPIMVIDGVLPGESYIMTSLIFNRMDKEDSANTLRAYREILFEMNQLGLVHYRKPVAPC